MNRTRSAVDRMAAQVVPDPDLLDLLDRTAVPGQRGPALARILAEPRSRVLLDQPAPLSWRPVLVVAAVLVVLLATVLVAVPALRPAPATPAPLPAPVDVIPELLTYDPTTVEKDPAKLLTQLADRAAAQPDRTGQGSYDYVHTRLWDVGGSNGALAGKRLRDVLPTDNEVWIGADRSGRSEVTVPGAGTLSDNTFVPGTAERLAPLPADPADIEVVVAGVTGVPVMADELYFDSLAQRWLKQVVPPREQAAFLRALAGRSALTVAGAVTDRAGRAGVGVTARRLGDGWTDITMIFDPETGALLEEDTVVREMAGRPDIGPTTSGAVVFLGSGRVNSLDERL
jgi:hypothetical protein